MKQGRYLSAREAAAALGISLQTLYAYVSRGLIRSEPAAGGRRTRRYHREDVQRLQARKEWRRDPERATQSALHAGAPVLESALTLIADDGLYYCGKDALTLATGRSIEEVAALLWTGDLEAEIPGLAHPPDPLFPARYRALHRHLDELGPMEAFQVALPLAAAEDLAAYDLQPQAVVRTGARILYLLAAVAARRRSVRPGIARTLQEAWVPDQPGAAALINAALVLCADHELNASTFTARCAASTGATPYAVVSAGLAALQGYRHGGASAEATAFLREVETRALPRESVAERLRSGRPLPGFGHVVYRDVDPRARLLLQLLAESHPDSPALALTRQVVQLVHQETHLRYNLDLALATLARVLSLPEGGTLALFALGRCAGWIGHALEQYRMGQLIRPRARYVGVQPEGGS